MDIVSPSSVVIMIVIILLFLGGAIINAAIISGIFHIFSKVSKRSRFAFKKVFPYALIVSLILAAIITFG